MEVGVCPHCQGKVGQGLSICPHCYQSLLVESPPLNKAVDPLALPYVPSGPNFFLWGVCVLLAGAVSWGFWEIHQVAPQAHPDSAVLDNQGKPLILPTIIKAARQALQSKHYLEAVSQARLGLTFLDFPGERDGEQVTAEQSLRLVLAEARESQGRSAEAIAEYRWLWEHDEARRALYGDRIEHIVDTWNIQALAAARKDFRRAQQLAKSHETRKALALADGALGQLEDHLAPPEELGTVNHFVAEQYLQLGERGRARGFLEKAADLGVNDNRLAALRLEHPQARPRLVTKSFSEERLNNNFTSVPEIVEGSTSYPLYQGPSHTHLRKEETAKNQRPSQPPLKMAQAPPQKARPRLVLPSLSLPENGRDTLPTYQSKSGSDTLPGYESARAGGTLPGYDTDKRP